MPTLRDLINNLKAIEKELPEILRQSATVMAHDGKALAERIIIDKGFGESYSTNEIPSYWLYGKELNASGKTYLDNLEGEGTNWGEFRKAQGRQNGHVDLNYSTRMWKGMRPDEVQQNGNIFICFMGHNDNEGRNKMNWNFDRYGDFIGKALIGQEDVLFEIAEENIFKLLEKYL